MEIATSLPRGHEYSENCFPVNEFESFFTELAGGAQDRQVTRYENIGIYFVAHFLWMIEQCGSTVVFQACCRFDCTPVCCCTLFIVMSSFFAVQITGSNLERDTMLQRYAISCTQQEETDLKRGCVELRWDAYIREPRSHNFARGVFSSINMY